ncbi:hypothetical protein BRARA_B02231 [Brassica rapa]|uniref:Uncharacterized protein n=1 Tax=Brassica campestris TaxID=3711 RepID=A0A398AEZ1_BRACM|nr:hypothetical protein BRARA_B02231 [Brassica rapa]
MKTSSSLVVIFLLVLTLQTNKLESGHVHSTDEDTVKNINNNIDKSNITTKIVLKDKKISSHGGGSNSYRWGGSGGGGGGSGGGGGGGGWYKWACGRGGGREGRGEFVKREYAECKGKGKCRGKRLECPQHCGGFCFYDCLFLCKPHCRR